MPPPGAPDPGAGDPSRPAPPPPPPQNPPGWAPAPGAPQPGPPQYGAPQPGAPQPGYAPPPPGYPTPPPGYQQYPGGPGGGWGPANPATQFGELAGFGTRLGGYLLDALLYGLLFAIGLVPGIVFIVQAFDDCSRITSGSSTEIVCVGDQFDGGALAGGVAAIGVAFLIVAFVYLRALAKTGQTWGRRIVGIKVINEQTGAPPGWGKALGRSLFAGLISAQILYIGYLWMLWDDKKQTLHDKVASTHVIRT